MWKWALILGLGAFAGIAGGGYWLVASGTAKELVTAVRPPEKKPEVRLETVSRGDLVQSVNAPGTVVARTKVQISAQVSSKILELPFREGQEVRKGDVIVRLDAEDYEALLASAEASLKGEDARLAGSRANYAQALAAVGRSRELFTSKDVSRAALDDAEAAFLRAEADVKASEFGIEIAKANIARARKNLELTTILAPMDGTIVKLNSEVGEQVLGTFNNAGSVIMEIADLRAMLLRARVDESNVAPVAPGQSASVTLNAFRNRTFTGEVERVRLVREVARDGTGYIEAEILLKLGAEDRLFSEGIGNADITVQTLRDVIRVPTQAVLDRRVDEIPKDIADASPFLDRRKAFTWVVYRVNDHNKTVVTPVTVGTSDLTHTVVLQGLSEGDRVVVGPYKSLINLKHDQEIVDEATKPKETPKNGAESKTAAAGPAH